MAKNLNKIRAVLTGKQHTNSRFAWQSGPAPATVSKWRANSSHPPFEALMHIARVPGVTTNDLPRLEVMDENGANLNS